MISGGPSHTLFSKAAFMDVCPCPSVCRVALFYSVLCLVRLCVSVALFASCTSAPGSADLNYCPASA